MNDVSFLFMGICIGMCSVFIMILLVNNSESKRRKETDQKFLRLQEENCSSLRSMSLQLFRMTQLYQDKLQNAEKNIKEGKAKDE